MLLETWFISSLYTAYGLTKYFLDSQRLVSKTSLHPSLQTADTLEEVNPPVEKCIELSSNVKEWNPPVYMNLGSSVGVGVPISGGYSDDMKTIATFVKPKSGTDLITPSSMRILDLERPADKQYWLNTPDCLKEYISQNSIHSSSFPAVLPMFVREFTAPSNTRMFKHKDTGIMGSDILAVAKAVATKRHFKNTPFIMSASLAGCTTLYIMITWYSPYDSQKHRIQHYKKRLGF